MTTGANRGATDGAGIPPPETGKVPGPPSASKPSARLVLSVFSGLQIGLFFVLRALPKQTASDVGAFFGRWLARRFNTLHARHLRKNVAALMPGMSDGERAAFEDRYWAGVGRTYAEYSVIERLRIGEDLHLHGDEIVRTQLRGRPTILAIVHLSSWEALLPVLTSVDRPLAAFVQPPTRPAEAWLAERLRRKFGVELLGPQAASVRIGMRRLAAGGMVSFFVDEPKRGDMKAPLFGREPPLDGNLAMVARLARRTGATIVPIHVLRRGERCIFDARALGPVDLPPGDDTPERIREDVRLLNGYIEPAIRANLDQWFFLHHGLKLGVRKPGRKA